MSEYCVQAGGRQLGDLRELRAGEQVARERRTHVANLTRERRHRDPHRQGDPVVRNLGLEEVRVLGPRRRACACAVAEAVVAAQHGRRARRPDERRRAARRRTVLPARREVRHLPGPGPGPGHRRRVAVAVRPRRAPVVAEAADRVGARRAPARPTTAAAAAAAAERRDVLARRTRRRTDARRAQHGREALEGRHRAQALVARRRRCRCCCGRGGGGCGRGGEPVVEKVLAVRRAQDDALGRAEERERRRVHGVERGVQVGEDVDRGRVEVVLEREEEDGLRVVGACAGSATERRAAGRRRRRTLKIWM